MGLLHSGSCQGSTQGARCGVDGIGFAAKGSMDRFRA